MKRRLLSPLALCLTAALAASCSGGSSNDKTPAPDTPAVTARAGTPAPGGTPGDVMVPQIHATEGLTTVEIAAKLAPSIVRVQVGVQAIDIFGRQIPEQGVGTGVIIDTAGHIVTNNHVITAGTGTQAADKITVTLYDQRSVPATIVGRDQATDLAVIKIDEQGLAAAAFADPASLQVGEDVVAIGFALDLEGAPTVTRGVISAKNRTIEEQPFTIPDAIQTDAGINPGNSGGPLVNAFGEIVGINTAIIRGAQNIGFSISVGLVQPTVKQLIENGQVERAYLGIGSVDVNDVIVRNFNLPVSKGIVVTTVGSGSPAEAAGFRENDVIVTVDGRPIANNGELLATLAAHRPGDTITIEYYRGPEKQSSPVTLSARPE